MSKSIVSILLFTLLATSTVDTLSAAEEKTCVSLNQDRLIPLIDAYQATTNKPIDPSLSPLQILQQMDPMELVSSLEELWQRFLDLRQYPDLSFQVLCDVITTTLDQTSFPIPDNLKKNIHVLIEEKRKCTNINKLTAEHRVCNLILIDVINIAEEYLQNNCEKILTEINPAELDQVLKELIRIKKLVNRAERSKKAMDFNTLINEVQGVYTKLQPIYQKIVQQNPEWETQVNQRVERVTRGNLDMVRILEYRMKNVTSLVGYLANRVAKFMPRTGA